MTLEAVDPSTPADAPFATRVSAVRMSPLFGISMPIRVLVLDDAAVRRLFELRLPTERAIVWVLR